MDNIEILLIYVFAQGIALIYLANICAVTDRPVHTPEDLPQLALMTWICKPLR